MKNQLMIDIETTGQNPGCKVLSLGAYGFNRDGNAVEFYCKFDAGKQDADGLTDEHATMEDFWAKQSREAFEEAFSGKTAPAEGIGEFKIWFLKNFSTEYEDRFRVWACGLDFDFPILKQFFKVYGYAFPWPFWTQYDYRTIKNVSRASRPTNAIRPSIRPLRTRRLRCADCRAFTADWRTKRT